MSSSASIGIIGGADGPTAIFITRFPLTTVITWGAIGAAVVIVMAMLFFKGRK